MNSEDICSIVNQVSSGGDYRYNLSLGKLLFKLKNSVRDVRHIRHMNYKIKGYKSALQMIFLI